MNFEEINAEILRDFEKITNSHQRLCDKYNRLRFDRKINKHQSFPYWFNLKSNSKNNWLVCFMKTPDEKKYDGQPEVLSLVFYINKIGFRVFHVSENLNIKVFNGHFFYRYNLRCKLGITTFLDIVKHFFENNKYSEPKFKINSDSILVIATSIKGVLLGEIQMQNKWVVFKTFIDRTMVNSEQSEIEELILEELQNEIMEIDSNTFGIDDHDLPFKKEFLKQLIEKRSQKDN